METTSLAKGESLCESESESACEAVCYMARGEGGAEGGGGGAGERGLLSTVPGALAVGVIT